MDYVLIPEGLLRDRVERLAKNIYRAYRDSGELTILVIMNSAFRFFTDLLHFLNKASEHEAGRLKIRPFFVKVTTQHLDQAVVDFDQVQVPVTEEQVKGRNVLIVEDIFDSGTTIIKTRDVLMKQGLASLKVCTLFHKKNVKNLKHKYVADFVGFLIPDVFVIGYGMDYNEYYRDLNHLCVINQAGIEQFK